MEVTEATAVDGVSTLDTEDGKTDCPEMVLQSAVSYKHTDLLYEPMKRSLDLLKGYTENRVDGYSENVERHLTEDVLKAAFDFRNSKGKLSESNLLELENFRTLSCGKLYKMEVTGATAGDGVSTHDTLDGITDCPDHVLQSAVSDKHTDVLYQPIKKKLDLLKRYTENRVDGYSRDVERQLTEDVLKAAFDLRNRKEKLNESNMQELESLINVFGSL